MGAAQHKMASSHKKGKRMDHERMSSQAMSAPAATDTDLSARDRQSRIDDAYSKWRASHS
jgi:hypothetical protein